LHKVVGHGDVGGAPLLLASKTGYYLSVTHTSIHSPPLLRPHPTPTHQ